MQNVVTGHTLVIRKIEDQIFYTKDRSIDCSRVHGYSFYKEYTLVYVLDYNALTRDCKISIDNTKLNNHFYNVWLGANAEFLDTLQIGGLFV